jgi:serine/threonine protein phosphatase PrpC
MEIHFFAKSDIGKVRTANEDFYLHEKIADNEYLFIVADGMGGHQAGDVASKLASETFLDVYKILRKKNTVIQQGMELAVWKANAVVFKKAASDIKKRGMGTTFSAVVIAGMKAYVAHVGDSRIYLVRNNKIKRITTDHSFVEKLVEEGRITADEARDHPQKNVLYMSLGARESFTPEFLNDIVLEEGDALVMCSDGLCTMVTDEKLNNAVMEDYPEKAAEALVQLANDNGGLDNITVQVIRIGSLEILEKTKPIQLGKPRKKMITLLAMGLLLALLAVLWYFFSPPSQGAAKTKPDIPVALQAEPRVRKAQKLSAVDATALHGLNVTPVDCRFLSGGKLYLAKKSKLFVFDLQQRLLRTLDLGAEDQVVPSADGKIYLFKRNQTATLGYRLIMPGAKKTALLIQDARNLFSKGIDSFGVPIFEIANIRTGITPDFINENIFIFHDYENYFQIKNWQTPENLPVKIPDLAVVPQARLFFKNLDGWMTMLYSNLENDRAAVFLIKDTIEKIREYPVMKLGQPLAMEFLKDQALACYYPQEYIELRGDREEDAIPYETGISRLGVAKILVDMADGRKLLVTNSGQFFTLGGE